MQLKPLLGDMMNQLCNSFLNMNYAHREDQDDIDDSVVMLKEA